MTGAIEFLRKEKAICKSVKSCKECPISTWCEDETPANTNEAEFVRTVMNYQIKEVSHE